MLSSNMFPGQNSHLAASGAKQLPLQAKAACGLGSFPLALSTDQSRPRSFQLGGRQGQPDPVEKERGLVRAKQRGRRMSAAARGTEVR